MRTKLITIAAAFVATSMVWSGGTFSAFDKTSAMPGNSVAAGTVTLSDNDSGTSPLSDTGVRPGDPATVACVNVSYTGSAPATVRLYGTVGGTGLASYLTLTVTRGTFSGTPAAGSCTGFTADTTGSVLYTGALSAFPVTSGTAIADPDTSWTNGEKRGYMLSLSLPAGAASAAQAKTATAAFTWQAVST